MNRNAADRLTQAEALTAMLATDSYRAADWNEAWRNILLYSEHTWGAARSISTPDAPMTIKQWDVKRQFAVDAEKESKDLLGQTLHS